MFALHALFFLARLQVSGWDNFRKGLLMLNPAHSESKKVI
jgi:hypothetical protein